MDPARLLDGLDPSQRRAVTTPNSPLAILAGAGSGKTRVLTRRIAYRCLSGDADARHVLAVTFSRKAAGELDDRLRASGLRDLPAVGTFHALAYAQLRSLWNSNNSTPPTLLDRKARLLAQIVGSKSRFSAGDLAAEIEWAKARKVPPERYALAAAQSDRRTFASPEQVADFYDRYEREKRKRALVDFDDLLIQAADAMENDPSFAAAQRWRFRHLFVDEYQDLNPLQERLLRAWLGDRKDLAVVGDPNQAIYGWNGADASYLTNFAAQHPGSEVIRLEHSYRSTAEILTVAASSLGLELGVSLPAPTRTGGAAPSIKGYANELDEAAAIVRAIHDNHGPSKPWSAQAILIRTNAQSAPIEAAMRRSAIPYRVRGATSLLDDPYTKNLLKQLDRLNEPLATTISDLDVRVGEMRAELAAVKAPGETDDNDTKSDAGAVDDTSSLGHRLAISEQIVALGRDLLVTDPTARTSGFVGWLKTTLNDGHQVGRDCVTISTFHAAKGLEWEVVHVAGLEAGYVPITHARSPEAKLEERRLLYVALTRAADVLSCTWAAQRTFASQTVSRKPSPWLAQLGSTISELEDSTKLISNPKEVLAQVRNSLHDRPRSSLAVRDIELERKLRVVLREWRAREAFRRNTVATVVLSDLALDGLARHRPTTTGELESLAELGWATREQYGALLLSLIASQLCDDKPSDLEDDRCASS